ncbi:MAG: alpha/beta fold hydrolase [Anaerolineae bacterium]|nr:alpha/beta fold hydrolase [Anaerolineae bacterium]
MKAKFLNVVALVGALLALTACGTPAPSPATALPAITPTPRPTPTPEFISTARFEPAPCPFVLPEGYIQGENVDCGWLIVPENRNMLPSRAIRLAVGIFHPAGGATRADPIIYLSGGPGGSALELIRYQFEEFFAPVMEGARRDLILFDQRGVGVSRPALDCPNVDVLMRDLSERVRNGHPTSEQETGDLVLAAYLACGENLRRVADLAAYNSAASAADVNDLRLALGYGGTLRSNVVNLWGASYGTRLALTVMRDHPEGLRSVVLDSVYPPDVDLYVEAPANFGRSLDLLFDSCAANPVCDEAYPDLHTVFFDTVERLNAAPVTRTITDTLTGADYATLFDGDALLGFVFQILYETEFKYLLPELIYDTSQDDFDALDRIRGALLAQRAATSPGMMFSVQCHEEVSFSSPKVFDAALTQYPEFAGLFERAAAGGLAYRVCAGWGAGQADTIENQPVASDVPALVLAGESDPVTPPAWGRRAAETLSNSYFFEYPGVGHGASAQDCGRKMMLAFLDNPAVAPDDGCIAGMERP